MPEGHVLALPQGALARSSSHCLARLQRPRAGRGSAQPRAPKGLQARATAAAPRAAAAAAAALQLLQRAVKPLDRGLNDVPPRARAGQHCSILLPLPLETQVVLVALIDDGLPVVQQGAAVVLRQARLVRAPGQELLLRARRGRGRVGARALLHKKGQLLLQLITPPDERRVGALEGGEVAIEV